MLIKHYYHIYANGRWTTPLDEHLLALTDSGLLDNLDFIGVGIVGDESERLKVKKYLPSEFYIVAEANSGWEQVTLMALSEDLQEPSKILYAHTKGAANNRHNQSSWRKEMTEGVVYNWAPCIKFLDQYDAIGCRWRRDPWRHFSGNFWWTTAAYASTLAPISCVYRDSAEAWIGQGSLGGTHVDLNRRQPELSETHSFGRIFVTEKNIHGSVTPFCGVDFFCSGDEFVGFLSRLDGAKIITQLHNEGRAFYIHGDTIIVR